MSVSLIDSLKERARQNLTGDENFHKSLPYFFKLRTKPNAGPTGFNGEAAFPLPIAPEVLEYDMPFAAEVSPLQEGGVVLDEGGITVASLRLTATTGFRLRPSKDTSFTGADAKWTGIIPNTPIHGQEISGQVALWRLLGRCFDAYSALKQDPETASETVLEWHNLKDKIFQTVVPRRVRVERNKDSARLIYRYHIECDVVGQAEFDFKLYLKEDLGLIDSIKNSIAAVRETIRQIGAVIDDLTAALDSIRRTLSDIVSIVSDLTSIVDAATGFISGAKSFFDLPRQFMQSVADVIDSTAELARTLGVDRTVYRSLAEAGDAVSRMSAAVSGHMRDDYQSLIDRRASRTAGNLTDGQKAAIAEIAARGSSAAGTLSPSTAYGGPFTPGDAKRAEITAKQDASIQGQYNGYREVLIGQGDTIQSLALQYLGSSNYWPQIALINRIKPPFIVSGARIPGTLRSGDPILIPVTRSTVPVAVANSSSVAAGASHMEQLFGADLKLYVQQNGKYSWVSDVAHGGTDVQVHAETPNLVQGLECRLRTERGTDLLFDVGLPRLVGGKSETETWAEARFAVQQQVLSDPRIDRVDGLQFSVDDDQLTIDVDVIPVGADTARQIPISV